MNTYFAEKNWYSGNLHGHSTRSDGSKTHEDVINWYCEHGYDFAAVTDHSVYGPPDRCGDFLVIAGIELPFHTVGLGLDGWNDGETPETRQAEIDAIRDRGGLAVVAHPYWHSLTIDHLTALQGHVGIEIYNSECDRLNGRGYSTVHWDYLLGEGLCVYGLAVDDIHWRHQNEGLGWITVNASERTHEAILEGIRTGAFYATQGPKIHQIEWNDAEIAIDCSPCQRVNLISNGPAGRVTIAAGKPLERAVFDITPAMDYVRLECQDAGGRTAWSNPIWPKTEGR